jgi:hypothetical protein
MSESLEFLMERAAREPKVLKQEEEKLRIERTLSKYQNTQLRIEEIEKKISRLRKEKENLVRKQETRRSFLLEQKEK